MASFKGCPNNLDLLIKNTKEGMSRLRTYWHLPDQMETIISSYYDALKENTEHFFAAS